MGTRATIRWYTTTSMSERSVRVKRESLGNYLVEVRKSMIPQKSYSPPGVLHVGRRSAI